MILVKYNFEKVLDISRVLMEVLSYTASPTCFVSAEST